VVDFSPDGKRFAVNEYQFVRIIDIASGQDVVKLEGHTGWVESGLKFSADGKRILTVAGEGTNRIWDAATGESLLTVFGNDPGVKTAALSPDGTRVATLSETSIQMWDVSPLESREWLAVPAEVDCDCTSAFSPDGLQLAVFSGDQAVKILDSHSGGTQLTLPDPDNQGRGLAFSPDGTRLATAGVDQVVHVWDLVTGKEVFVLDGSPAPLDRVLFSPDGTRLAAIAHNGWVGFWDAASRERLFTLRAFDNTGINIPNRAAIAFSPDGSQLATAGASSIKLWDTSSGEEMLALPEVKDLWAYAVAFSPDGKHVAVGFRGGSANVWDAVTGQKLFDLSGHTSSVRYLAYSPDGTRLPPPAGWHGSTGTQPRVAAVCPYGTNRPGDKSGLQPDGTRLAQAALREWSASTRCALKI
jgi:WD40 repeat protein